MMEITVVLILAAVCLLVGLLFGYLFGNMGKSQEQKQPLNLGEEYGLIEVVRFWSDADGKKIVPEVGGRLIRSLKELNADQYQRFTRLMEQLAQGNTTVSKGPQGVSVTREKPQTEPESTADVSADIPGLVTSPPAPLPSFSMLGALGKSLQPDIGKQPDVQKSIAAQIDEILQERLEGTPLAKKGIRLMELPGKGMVVMVGLEQYSGVGEVPDVEARQAIRAAVVEWENKVSTSEF
jgi:hypothetical protein